MKKTDIIRAWKDAEFREQLAGDAPANPAGELTTDDLRRVSGGNTAGSAEEARSSCHLFSWGCPCKPPRNTSRKVCR